jgi:uncharacterized membrane protein
MSNGKQTLFLVAFLGSLTLNIFLGGFFVGNYLGRGHGHGHPPPMGKYPFERELGIIRALPESSQAKLSPLVQKQKEVMRTQHQQVEQAQQAVFNQLTADPLNSQALLEALTKLQQEKSNIHNFMSQFLVDAASQLNREERQQLAEAMRRRPPPPPPEGGFPPPPPPPGE